MPQETLIVSPGPDSRTVRAQDGRLLTVPGGWDLLPPGDATLTRRVKAGGPTWTVQQMKGRKKFSRGVWAPAERIATERKRLESERETDEYKKRRASDLARRERKQTEYASDFEQAVFDFLRFARQYESLGRQMAAAIAAHATPVGSGTVARTQRIPIEERASAAVIAWMRHQTTAYDTMKIPRVRGKRREVRRKLAAHSQKLLATYRRGEKMDASKCPLQIAIRRIESAHP